jgi:hypothetical protein
MHSVIRLTRATPHGGINGPATAREEAPGARGGGACAVAAANVINQSLSSCLIGLSRFRKS